MFHRGELARVSRMQRLRGIYLQRMKLTRVSRTCETSYWPLIWILMSLGINFIAWLSLRTAMTRKKPEDVPPGASTGSEKWRRSGLVPRIRNEVTVSSNHDWQVSDLYNIQCVYILTLSSLSAECASVFCQVCC